MIQALTNLFQPEALFNPVGLPLGDTLQGVLILFGVIFAIGFVMRGVVLLVSKLNPYLRGYLRRLSFAIMLFGFLEVLYFLIREVRVAYITANIMFVVLTVVCVLWILYLVFVGYFVRYRRERELYRIEQERKAYLPKRKK